jgi:protein RecA
VGRTVRQNLKENMSASSLADRMLSVMGNADPEIKGWLSTTYSPLNKIISGNPDHGLPYGRIVEIYGPSGAGKTWLATQLMISAQNAGGCSIFQDHEYAYDLAYAVRQGLNPKAPHYVYGRPETLEGSVTKALEITEMIRDSKEIAADAPIVAVFDSIAAMVPRSVFEKGYDELTMADSLARAKALSTVLPSVNQKVAKMNATFVFLNQIRMKPGVVYGDPVTTPGGNAMEFYATVRLSLGRKIIKEEVDGEKEVTGQAIGIQTVKNRCARPRQEVDVLLRFNDDVGSEFDRTFSLLQVLIAEGKLVYSKPRVTWIDGKQYFVKALVDKIKGENLHHELEALYRS